MSKQFVAREGEAPAEPGLQRFGFTRIYLTSVVLVLNEMVLVLVIDSLVAIEHEHEITNNSRKLRRSRPRNGSEDEVAKVRQAPHPP